MRPPRLLLVLTVVGLAACAPAEKPEEVASKDTYECQLSGERWLVRFADSEARLLNPQGERFNLYQIPTTSGVRFSNGLIELRGRGVELEFIKDNFSRPMLGCKPLMIPKEEPHPMLRMWQPPPKPPLS